VRGFFPKEFSKMLNWIKLAVAVAVVGAMVVTVGCGQEAKDKPDGKDKKNPPVAEGGSGHTGWWCDEHGVKESECSMCDPKVFKKLKPDEICKNHPDRAVAQCFICNPDLWPKSVEVYKAKYPGKEPPAPDKNMPGKK
jgi:hypothetical protein